jgi:hypothetical protein
MTLATKNLSRFKSGTVPITTLNATTFKRKTKKLDLLYDKVDRDTQSFLRKMVMIRIADSEKLLKSGMTGTEEKARIRVNKVAYRNLLNKWIEHTDLYEV